MKKEISISLKDTYPSDFVQHGLELPAGLETVAGGSVLHFEGYEPLEAYAQHLQEVYLAAGNYVERDNIYQLHLLLDAEREYQAIVVASVAAYAKNFIHNLNDIEGFGEVDRLDLFRRAVEHVRGSENYRTLHQGLVELIRKERIFVEARDSGFAGYATDQALDFAKIRHALADKLVFLRTLLIRS
ncbi:hypothetical protein [Pedobacter sp. D749]|uniref:hypothetical protein n=1 Tax=Pedobacter sp. D749 TaxID=2856523 RepID=UPI001C58D953|nr:hypothetical protein [Pedobacter sp. D749]QXU43468.1 hypothetical protein KYH19_07760 [Pedobacter sp. D749]